MGLEGLNIGVKMDMYTILLVDDEKLELETLEQYVPWNEMGLFVTGTASNGKEALQKLSELKPDIVLTDVRMPIMDGLEFARRAKQIDKHVKIVFLSGHNEFQYIKAALHVEAVGYLLKPHDPEELSSLMERVKKKCYEDRLNNQGEEWVIEKLALELLRETNEDRRADWVRKLATKAPALPIYGNYAAAYVTADSLQSGGKINSSTYKADCLGQIHNILTEHFDGIITVEIVEHAYVALMNVKPNQTGRLTDRLFWEQVRTRVNTGMDSLVSVGLSSQERGLECLQSVYLSAKKSNEYKFYGKMGTVFMPEDRYETFPAVVDIEPNAADILNGIKQGIHEPAKAAISSFFSKLKNERVHKNQVLHGVIRMLTVIEQEFSGLLAGSNGDLLVTNHWKLISSMASLDLIEKYLSEYCEGIVSLLQERDKDRNLILVDQIITIIEERYHLPLTVDDIAKEVYLSPNYIRTIFKEKTGETILDHLIKTRIRRASELLQDKSLKIYEISHAVGYENVSYFCSVFHKHKGSTPNEYRKTYL